MRTTIPLRRPNMQNVAASLHALLKCLSPSAQVALVVLGSFLWGALLFAAQAPATPQATAAPAHKPNHLHNRPRASRTLSPKAQAAPTTIAPPVPNPPDWPVNDRAASASVVWDSHGLRIDAANSSLNQILKDVSVATGAQVEGLTSDERVFGAYGPGKARDVLAQLLEGSGYNLLMMGDLGQGAPRQIVLSVRHVGNTQPAAVTDQTSSSDEDVDADEPAQPTPVPPPTRQGFGPGAVPRSPQQIMQEMQQRQQQMQQPNPQ
jgi:hypothetical protein